MIKWKNINNEDFIFTKLQCLNLITCFYLIIFLVTPFSLFIFNSPFWENDFYLPLIVIGLGLFLVGPFYIICYFLFKFYPKFISLISYFFFIIAIIILCNDIIFPSGITNVGLNDLKSSEPIQITILELCLSALLFILFFFFRFRSDRIIFSITSIINSLSVIIIFIYSFLFLNFMYEKFNTSHHEFNSDKTNDIYLIHLDGFQSDFMEKYLNENDVSDEFDGFTFFKNNIANYPYTIPSIISYLTSSMYDGSDLIDWKSKVKSKSIFSKLKASGYKINYYGAEAYKDYVIHDKHISTHDVLKNNNINNPLIINFTQLFFIKIFPNFLTNEGVFLGSYIGNFIFKCINPSIPDYVANIEKAYGGGGAVMKFNTLIDDIKEQSNYGNVYYAILGLPHYPYSLDSECNYKNLMGKSSAVEYYEQIECANNLLLKLIRHLKSLKRYNSSIIYFFSDHGSHRVTELKNPYNYSFDTLPNTNKPYDVNMFPQSFEGLKAHARALLMIKPQNNNEPMEISNKQTQLLDIFPTLMNQVSLPISNLSGNDINNAEINFNDLVRKFSITDKLTNNFSTANFKLFDVSFSSDNHLQLLKISEESGNKVNITKYLEDLKNHDFKKIDFFYYLKDGLTWDNREKFFIEGIDTFGHESSLTKEKDIVIGFNVSQREKPYEALNLEILGSNLNEKDLLQIEYEINNKYSDKLILSNEELLNLPSKKLTIPLEPNIISSNNQIIFRLSLSKLEKQGLKIIKNDEFLPKIIIRSLSVD